MFKRIIFEDWHSWVPILSFVLTFAAFLVFFVRALLMKSDKAETMARLPLDDD